jgi:transposase InsO family protein
VSEKGKPSKKGTGFAQPLAAHQHWHIDVSYLNIGGTFYYLCGILDGYSRYIVNWDIRESMTEGHAGWAAAGDPRGARPEVGGGADATADSSRVSRLTFSLRPLGGGSAGNGFVQSHARVRSLNFRFAERSTRNS